MSDDSGLPHPSLAVGVDGQALSSFTKREIATLERLAEFFADDEHFHALKELLRLWQTLGGFGWFGRMLMIGMVSLASFIGATTLLLHWLSDHFGVSK